MSTFVNAFRESGICPLNPQAISNIKLSPSLAYSSESCSSESSVTLPKVGHFKCNGSLHKQIEKMMKPEMMELYQKRLEEGYDLENDELYVIWSQLKKMSISDQSAKKSDLPTQKELPKKQQIISTAFDEVLTYPVPKRITHMRTNKGKASSQMPKHLSSDQVIAYLTEKEEQKLKKEEEKQRCKEEREQKRLKREAEMKRKQLEKAEKERQRCIRRSRGRGRARGRGAQVATTSVTECSHENLSLEQMKKTLTRGRGRGRGGTCGRGRYESESSQEDLHF